MQGHAWHPPHLLVAGLLALTSFTVLPSASASTGCWYTETTQQELLAAGSDVVYLELDQPVYSGTCDPADTVPAAVRCAGVGTGDGTLTTPPVTIFEVRVLGVTVIEEGVLVPGQTAPVPEDPDVVLVDEPRCTSERPVARLVVETDGGDTIVGTDGTVEPGDFPFVDEIREQLPVPEDRRDLPGLFLPSCFDPDHSSDTVCHGGGGFTGIWFRLFDQTYVL